MSIVDNLIKSKNKPHAIIFKISSLANVNEIINNYIISIVCNGLDQERKNYFENKINSNEYFDVIKIDGYSNPIKKEDILNIQNAFSLSGIESINKKFYVIYGIENITKQAANSLLKFLEEPPMETYAIFVSAAPDSIIETIRSRCQAYYIEPSLKDFDDILKKYKINSKLEIDIARTYLTIDQLRNDLLNKEFKNKCLLIKQIIDCHSNCKLTKKTLDDFKSLSYIEIKFIIQVFIKLFPNNHKEFFNLYNLLKYNPNKTLLFDQIIENIK